MIGIAVALAVVVGVVITASLATALTSANLPAAPTKSLTSRGQA
jgi:hypothetical protein